MVSGKEIEGAYKRSSIPGLGGGLDEAQFERARRIRARNQSLVEESAKALLAKETLSDGELQAALGRVLPEEPRVAAARSI